ncbi:hypothetical protein JCM6882_002654 [Rhodosporidiobolus microsporus]
MFYRASSSRITRAIGLGRGSGIGSGGADEKREGEEQHADDWEGQSVDDDDLAEPVKKKARKTTKSKGKGKGKVSKKNEGKLAPLLDMPVEIFTEIAGHLDPVTLLYMSRASKAFHQLFASRSSRSIWEAARTTVDLPDLEADDFSEMAYASLMFEKVCHVCGKDRAVLVNFDFRHHGSGKTKTDYDWIYVPDLRIINDKLHALQEQAGTPDQCAAETLVVARVKVMVRKKRVEENGGDEFKPEEKELKEFVERRRALLPAVKADSETLKAWHEAVSNNRSEALQDLKIQRIEVICEKIDELGHDKDDMFPLTEDIRKLCVQPRPLTDTIWQRISVDILAHLEKNRNARLEAELAERASAALEQLRPYYNTVLAAFETADDSKPFLPLEAFIHLPSVAQFWADEFPKVLSTSAWSMAMATIMREANAAMETAEGAEAAELDE